MFRPRTVLPLLALIALIALTSPVAAQEPPPAPEPDWTGNIGLAYLATSGNTDTSSFGLDFKLERKPEPWGLEIVGLFRRAEEDGLTTAERYLASVRGKRALSERWEVFAGISGEKDEFAGYDLLTILEAGATYKALTGPRHLLSFDFGATYTDEDRIAPEPDVSYVGAVLGLGYEWKLSENASLTEKLVFYPNFDESSDWRLNSLTALQANLTSRLAVKLGYEVRYRNEPIGDNDDTDTATTASLVFKL